MTSIAGPIHPRSPAGRVAPGRRRFVVDVVVAGVYAAVFLGFTVLLLRLKVVHLPWLTQPGAGIGFVTLDIRVELVSRVSIALMVACAVALAWRRAKPATSFLVICAIACLQVAVGEPISAWDVAMPISLFSAAAYASRGFGRASLLIAVAGYLAVWVLATNLLGRLDSLPNLPDVLTTARGAGFLAVLGLLVLIWAAGDQVRAARERFGFALERASQQQRELEADARLGAMAERQRIARELHDVVAHGLSVMIVQADGALYAAAEHPEAPGEALATIAATGRESLAEMRRLLGVLRDGPEAAATAPQPEVDAIPELIEGFRGAGLSIGLAVDGPSRRLEPVVSLTAYRVVQESLTNVLQHAGTTSARVRIAYGTGVLGLEIANDPGAGPAATPPRPSRGLGLVGMRERVGLVGGTMWAGPVPTGGFLVRVEIPDPMPGAWAAPAWSRADRHPSPPHRASGRQ